VGGESECGVCLKKKRAYFFQKKGEGGELPDPAFPYVGKKSGIKGEMGKGEKKIRTFEQEAAGSGKEKGES